MQKNLGFFEISGGAEKTITLFIFYFFKNYQSYGSYIWYTSWQRYL